MRFVAGQGATAESHREYVAGRGAAAENLCGRGCRSAEADAAPTEELAAATAKHGVAPSGSTCEQGEAVRAGRSNAGREEHCGQGEALRAGRSSASREKQCWQGEALRAGRSSASREEQCGLLVDEDGEVVASEYLLCHALELCGCETLYFGTGGLHWLYVAEDHH